MKKEFLVGILLVILIILAGIVGYLLGQKSSYTEPMSTQTMKQEIVNETTVIKTVYSPSGDPASIGNGEDYLINPVFPL
jgi:hypothetical protein